VEAEPDPFLNKRISDELAKPSDSAPEHLAISAVTEIEELMADLVSARDYLKGEAERIQRETVSIPAIPISRSRRSRSPIPIDPDQCGVGA
jgi:hypothetical protein